MTNHDRRRFLRNTSIAAGVTLGITSATAAADQTQLGYVSTRGHFDCDGDLVADPESYETHGVPCFDRGCADELTIHVHGWKNKEDKDDAQEGFATVDDALDSAGYDGELVGWSWDSDCGWYSSKDNAWGNGRKLARFVRDYRHLHGDDPTVRITTHSLGARVGFSAAYHLADADVTWEAVRSVHHLGGAIPWDWPDQDRFQSGLIDAVGASYNYVNGDDSILGWGAYKWAEAGGNAVGRYGSENGGSCNFQDWDVTDWWDSSHGLGDYVGHCNDLIVADMNRVDEYDNC